MTLKSFSVHYGNIPESIIKSLPDIDLTAKKPKKQPKYGFGKKKVPVQVKTGKGGVITRLQEVGLKPEEVSLKPTTGRSKVSDVSLPQAVRTNVPKSPIQTGNQQKAGRELSKPTFKVYFPGVKLPYSKASQFTKRSVLRWMGEPDVEKELFVWNSMADKAQSDRFIEPLMKSLKPWLLYEGEYRISKYKGMAETFLGGDAASLGSFDNAEAFADQATLNIIKSLRKVENRKESGNFSRYMSRGTLSGNVARGMETKFYDSLSAWIKPAAAIVLKYNSAHPENKLTTKSDINLFMKLFNDGKAQFYIDERTIIPAGKTKPNAEFLQADEKRNRLMTPEEQLHYFTKDFIKKNSKYFNSSPGYVRSTVYGTRLFNKSNPNFVKLARTVLNTVLNPKFSQILTELVGDNEKLDWMAGESSESDGIVNQVESTHGEEAVKEVKSSFVDVLDGLLTATEGHPLVNLAMKNGIDRGSLEQVFALSEELLQTHPNLDVNSLVSLSGKSGIYESVKESIDAINEGVDEGDRIQLWSKGRFSHEVANFEKKYTNFMKQAQGSRKGSEKSQKDYDFNEKKGREGLDKLKNDYAIARFKAMGKYMFGQNWGDR